jgi:hypothetical protein
MISHVAYDALLLDSHPKGLWAIASEEPSVSVAAFWDGVYFASWISAPDARPRLGGRVPEPEGANCKPPGVGQIDHGCGGRYLSQRVMAL